MKQSEALIGEYEDGLRLAEQTARIHISMQISNLQNIGRRVDELQPPSCARSVQMLLAASINNAVEGFLDFAAERDYSAGPSIEEAKRKLDATKYALSQFANTSSDISPLTRSELIKLLPERKWKSGASERNFTTYISDEDEQFRLNAGLMKEDVFVLIVNAQISTVNETNQSFAKLTNLAATVLPDWNDREKWLEQLKSRATLQTSNSDVASAPTNFGTVVSRISNANSERERRLFVGIYLPMRK